MFDNLKGDNAIQNMDVADLNALCDEIATFLVRESHYDLNIVFENLNVLEVTIALHKVFDNGKDIFVFDGGKQTLVHKIVTGRYESLKLRNEGSLYLDPDRDQDAYGGGRPGAGLGVGLGYAITAKGHVVVIMDTASLAHGTTYEALLDIQKNQTKLIIVVIDEQKSLLRHYTSLNKMVKSIRISKAYTALKQDMKHVLGGSSLGDPILSTMKRVRDALKDNVLESTIFTQMGIDYQGPIDGQNLEELLRSFEVAKNTERPQVIHVQTRIKNTKKRKLEFPAFKMDQTLPDDYVDVAHVLDAFCTEKAGDDADFFLLASSLLSLQHVETFLKTHPRQFFHGAIDTLFGVAYALIRMGKHVLIVVDGSESFSLPQNLVDGFNDTHTGLTIALLNAGLNSQGDYFHQNVFDTSVVASLNPIRLSMGSTLAESIQLLDRSLMQKDPAIQLIRFPDINERKQELPAMNPHTVWKKVLSSETRAVILTYGASVDHFKKRILANQYDVTLINCMSINAIDLSLMQAFMDEDKTLYVYEVDSWTPVLYQTLLHYFKTHQLKLHCISYTLSGTDLHLSSRELKKRYHLGIDDVLQDIASNSQGGAHDSLSDHS